MEPLSHKGSGGVRISTHLYNANEDVVRLLEAPSRKCQGQPAGYSGRTRYFRRSLLVVRTRVVWGSSPFS